jgi:hypothetical protein
VPYIIHGAIGKLGVRRSHRDAGRPGDVPLKFYALPGINTSRPATAVCYSVSAYASISTRQRGSANMVTPTVVDTGGLSPKKLRYSWCPSRR